LLSFQQGGFLSRVLCNSVLGDHFIGSSSSGVHPLYGWNDVGFSVPCDLGSYLLLVLWKVQEMGLRPLFGDGKEACN